MIHEFPLAEGLGTVWLVRSHIVSLQANREAPGTIIRMTNGDQWAVMLDVADIIPINEGGAG